MRLIKQQHACEAHWGFKTETQFSTSARNQGVVLLFVCVWGGGFMCMCMPVCVHACMCLCVHVCMCTYVYACLSVAARGQPWASSLATAYLHF